MRISAPPFGTDGVEVRALVCRRMTVAYVLSISLTRLALHRFIVGYAFARALVGL
jgi:hypothetical protein